MSSSFSLFRLIAFLEGLSYVALIINMLVIKNVSPDLGKTIGYPIGLGHGVLVVLYIALALLVKINYKKSYVWLFITFFVSLIPLGTFFMEGRWKKEEQEYIADSKTALLAEN